MQVEGTRRRWLHLLGISVAVATARIVYAENHPTLLPEDPDQAPLSTSILLPLLEIVERRRQGWSEDSEYQRRIDDELNQGRLNILLHSWGETHEPPEIERAIIATQTIFSLDTSGQTAAVISWTHDIRAPEVERQLREEGRFDNVPKRIDQALQYGGIPLMRRVVESATGLSVDVVIAFPDTIVKSLVDDVTGPIPIHVPKSFWAHPVYIDGQKYGPFPFGEGMISLDGTQTLQLIKAVPINDTDPRIEHNRRKHVVMRSILSRIRSLGRTLKLINFLKTQIDTDSLSVDIDLGSLIFHGENLRTLRRLATAIRSGEFQTSLFPSIEKTIYIVDPTHGDGGVQWARANAATNPISRQDMEAGLYPKHHGWEVPHVPGFNANPYADDLVNDYWLPMRKRIKDLLLS